MLTFQPSALRAVTHLIARRMGSDEAEATEVADHLVRANLAGHDSHGVGMLPTYVRLLHDKLLVPNQTPETILDAGALLIVDARRGYGQRMAADAVRRAIGKAREHGACVLGLRDSAHIGRIGTYAELAVGQGCAWISFVNVADLMMMFRSIADVVQKTDLRDLLTLPRIRSGRPYGLTTASTWQPASAMGLRDVIRTT